MERNTLSMRVVEDDATNGVRRGLGKKRRMKNPADRTREESCSCWYGRNHSYDINTSTDHITAVTGHNTSRHGESSPPQRQIRDPSHRKGGREVFPACVKENGLSYFVVSPLPT
ncbi:hypothetical protein DPEC_G00065070 [Dallia pectoralis]|uniref:Uncharacterized protein n=1 Tax=Dallia pectoralis TaxID=75939 RepID=A0ACC2H8L6_DALPE|nr:hypothetical protein DPEC_G00065070 [Dallia pectoralis]